MMASVPVHEPDPPDPRDSIPRRNKEHARNKSLRNESTLTQAVLNENAIKEISDFIRDHIGQRVDYGRRPEGSCRKQKRERKRKRKREEQRNHGPWQTRS